MTKSHYCGSAFNATAIALALAIILVLSTLISMIIPISENAFAYEKNQATSQASDCGNGQEPENIGCQNIGSSIQGDENAVNIIGQQSFPTRTVKPPPEETATLIVIKKVACVPGEECSPLPAATEFMLSVTDELCVLEMKFQLKALRQGQKFHYPQATTLYLTTPLRRPVQLALNSLVLLVTKDVVATRLQPAQDL